MNNKLIEWMNLDDEQKRKYNGYDGFVNSELFRESNLFLKPSVRKSRRKNER